MIRYHLLRRKLLPGNLNTTFFAHLIFHRYAFQLRTLAQACSNVCSILRRVSVRVCRLSASVCQSRSLFSGRSVSAPTLPVFTLPSSPNTHVRDLEAEGWFCRFSETTGLNARVQDKWAERASMRDIYGVGLNFEGKPVTVSMGIGVQGCGLFGIGSGPC